MAVRKKSDTKNVIITKEQEAASAIPVYRPSDPEMEVIKSVFYKFRMSADHRNKGWQNFDGQTLIQYINDASLRFITNVDYMRDDIEDWQARVHDKFTQNKVIAFLSKMVQVLPVAEFSARGEEDYRKAQILTNLYEYSEDVDDYEELLINLLLECIMKGTAIGYEGHEMHEKTIREVTGSGDDIKITSKKRRTNKLFGAIVPLEDFYPSSVGVRKIKDMPFCFWRSTLPYQQFLADYAQYGRASKVQPKANYSDKEASKPYYLEYISDDVQLGQVEIIRYYNRDTDEYIIIANGVWLNPVMDKENANISPLPFTHKELPFWDMRFELLPNFFYGRALPDKLKAMQDVLNVLTNMLLDQSFLTIFKPMLTSGFDSIEDDYLRPGRRTPVDTQGMSIKDQYMVLDSGAPNGWHQFILDYTRRIMSEASLDQVQSGTAGVGGRTTAEEIRTATEGVASVLGLFARLVNFGIKRKALLRAKNILQFWTDKNSPVIDQVLGEGGSSEMKDCFNTFKIDNTVLSSGKRGIKIIEMYANKKKMPTKTQQANRALLKQTETNKKVEIISIPGEYIRSLDFDIKLGVNKRSENTRELQKAMMLEKVRVYMSFFPQIVDQVELAAQMAELMGDDPTKIIKPDAMQQALGAAGSENAPQAANSMQDGGVSTLPENAIAPNAVNGMLGTQGAASNLQALQAMITG